MTRLALNLFTKREATVALGSGGKLGQGVEPRGVEVTDRWQLEMHYGVTETNV